MRPWTRGGGVLGAVWAWLGGALVGGAVGAALAQPVDAGAGGAWAEEDWGEAAPRGTAVGRSVVLRFFGGKDAPPIEARVVLKDAARAKRALRSLVLPWRVWATPVVPRLDADPAAVAQAVERAAGLLDAYDAFPALPEGTEAAERERVIGRHVVARQMVFGVLESSARAGALADRPVVAEAPAERAWQVLSRARSLALSESLRGGLVPDGALLRRLDAGDAVWRRAAGALLAPHGVAAGADAVLEALGETERLDQDAAWALVTLEGERALDAARRALAGIIEREAATPTLTQSYVANPTAAVVAYLLVHGDAGDAERIAGLTLGPTHAVTLARLTDDPASLVEAAGAGEGWNWALQAMAQDAVASAGEDGATAAAAEEVLYVIGERWERVTAGRANVDNAATFRAKLEARCSFARASEGTARYLAKGQVVPKESRDSLLEAAPWIAVPGIGPRVLEELATGNRALLGQMWHLGREEIGALAATEAWGRAFAEPELAEAYFTLFAMREPGPSGRVAGDEFVRGLMLSHEEAGGVYGGAVSAVLRVRPAVIDGRLVVRARVDAAAAYVGGSLVDFKEGKRENYEHHRYVADEGRALLQGVRAAQRGETLAVRAVGRVADGSGRWMVYEAALPTHDAEGIVVQVDLAFFDRRPCVVLDLGGSGVLREHRRAVAAMDAARGAWQREPTAANALRLADVAEASGRLGEAAGVLRGAGLEAREAALVLRAIDLLTRAGDAAGAARVWEEGIAAGVFEAGARFDAAGAWYAAGDGARAAALYEAVEEASPGDAEARLWGAVCAVMAAGDGAGDGAGRARAARLLRPLSAAEAGAVGLGLGVVCAADEVSRAAALATLAEAAAGEEADPAIVQVHDALRRGPAEVPWWWDGADRCRVLVFQGYGRLLAGRGAEARALFQAAVEAGDVGQVERRMAEAELARVPAP